MDLCATRFFLYLLPSFDILDGNELPCPSVLHQPRHPEIPGSQLLHRLVPLLHPANPEGKHRKDANLQLVGSSTAEVNKSAVAPIVPFPLGTRNGTEWARLRATPPLGHA